MERTQDYLKAIHCLGGSQKAVGPTEIAAYLGVRPSSACSMLGRLNRAGWVRREPRRGATLTSRGLLEARRVLRRHGLVEQLLSRVLRFDWSEAHAEADALEHAVSPRLEQALADYLGEPTENPYGHPIPSSAGSMPRRDLRPLCDLGPGRRCVIREVADTDPERLRHWQALGLVPGVTVDSVCFHPPDDMFEVQVGSNNFRLGRMVLEGLWGELVVD